MANLPRRRFCTGTIVLYITSSRAFAQGQCTATGMPLDEALQAWKNEQEAAKLDRTTFNVAIKRKEVVLYREKIKKARTSKRMV
ncbi:hypothetical protein PTKU46_82980 [Paraburkholderia terrae]|uniref:hypothetical protein n=1 Tax=Paraburkholderia terrae TaxID=311230 RepID=UPI0030E39E9D